MSRRLGRPAGNARVAGFEVAPLKVELAFPHTFSWQPLQTTTRSTTQTFLLPYPEPNR